MPMGLAPNGHHMTETRAALTDAKKLNSGDVGKAPQWLPKKAKLLWKMVADHYADLPILSEIDRPALTSLCLAAAKIEDMERLIAAAEDIDEEKAYVKLRKEYETTFKTYSANFGLSPKERMGLQQALREADVQMNDEKDALVEALRM